MKFLITTFLFLFGIQMYGQVIVKHVANKDNTQGHITTINSNVTNGKSNAILIVTQNYGAYNNNEIGVWYAAGKWKIFNQNRKAIPKNSKFNILVLPANTSQAFVHTTTNANSSNHITTLNSILTNSKPNALIYITQRFGKYNTSNAGVWYSGGKWRIYNEKTAKDMPIGTQFNILVVDPGRNRIGNSDLYAFKYSNSSTGHVSLIDSPVALARTASLFTTQNWRNVYNPNITGVWYSGRNWTVYNQNRKTLATGTRFNVLAGNYRSIEMREEKARRVDVLSDPQPTAETPENTEKSIIKLPTKVNVQNLANKFSFNTIQKEYLNTHAAQKTKIVDFYNKNQTVSGKQFAELALATLMNDGYVNLEEAFIEVPTNDFSSETSFDALEEEGSVSYIPFPIVLSTLDTVEIKFGTTTSDQMHANQKVSLVLVEGIKEAVEKANNNLLDTDKIKSIYIMATTNGKHGSNSNHYHGAAADISRINDEKMALSGVTYQIIQLQNAFDEYAYVRENFGPSMKHKYTLENDSWDYDYDVGGHTTHIHISVRK